MDLSLLTPLFALFAAAFLCLLVCCIYLIVRLLIYLLTRKRTPFRPFGYAALFLVFFGWVLIGYGYWVGRFQIEVKPTTYSHTQLPTAFEGYKIVQISDLHLATFADRPSALQRVVDSINAQTPDLICFTGDIVTIGVEEALPFKAIMQQLHARDGIFSVLGNHDLMIYRDFSPAERLRQVEQ